MITNEVKENLKKLGFDVDALINAIKSEKEETVPIPDLYTETDKKEYGNNRAKAEQKIVREIVAKEIAKKYGVEVSTKDPVAVVESVANKKIEEAKLPTDKQLEEAQKTIAALQEKYTAAEQQLNETKQEYENRMFNVNLRQKAISIIPDNTIIPKDDLLDLFFTRAAVKKSEDGNIITELGGKVLKDKLENPLPFENVVKSFAEKYVTKGTPPGGGGGGAGTPPDKFHKLSELSRWAKDNDIIINSPDFNKILIEKQADDFEFDDIPEDVL